MYNFTGFYFVNFPLGLPRWERLEQKMIFFKSLNFATSPNGMENLNPPKTLYSILVQWPYSLET